jgi:hypothetical protein
MLGKDAIVVSLQHRKGRAGSLYREPVRVLHVGDSARAILLWCDEVRLIFRISNIVVKIVFV